MLLHITIYIYIYYIYIYIYERRSKLLTLGIILYFKGIEQNNPRIDLHAFRRLCHVISFSKALQRFLIGAHMHVDMYFVGRNACRSTWRCIAMVVIFADTGNAQEQSAIVVHTVM